MLIIKNKVLFYLVSRYATYAVQFLTSLLIAAKLGPYYMGIWGFVLLLLQYFQQFHFGIANSFNVLYIQHRGNQQECYNYIGNSLVILSVLCTFIVFIYILYLFCGGALFDRYHVDKYMLWVCLIAILQYYVEFLTNLFRVKNLLNYVAFCQSIIVFLCLFCVIFSREEKLIQWLVASYVIGNSFCVLLGFISGVIPKYKQVQFSLKCQKEILNKGLYLFLYNSCFYFIIISIRTIISDNYSVEEFGLFSFSYTLAYSIFFIIGALGFVIFPKVIGKLSSNDNKEVKDTISFLRKTYVTSTHFLVYLAIFFFPLLLYFMPQYDGSALSFNLIALTILITTCSYGYLELLISKNRERLMSLLSASALILNIIIGMIIVKYFNVSFSYVIVATLITYIIYSFTVLCFGLLILKDFVWHRALMDYFPLRLFCPYLSALLCTFLMCEYFMWIPVVLFILLNRREGVELFETIKAIIINPNKVNL